MARGGVKTSFWCFDLVLQEILECGREGLGDAWRAYVGSLCSFLIVPTQAELDDYCLVAKLCLTLCHSMDCSPPGSSVRDISQARVLEWLP